MLTRLLLALPKPVRKPFLVNISSDDSLLARRLSNFTRHQFTLDGVVCGSMEGFLQSLKYPDPEEQALVAGLSGKEAWRKGRVKRAARWKESQELTWCGVTYDRGSEAYQLLLSRAFDALATNPQFRADLLATGRKRLAHTIGKTNRRAIVLTEAEFVSQLARLRSRLAG